MTKRILVFLAQICALFGIIIALIVLMTPSRAQTAIKFVGSGNIIESDFKSYGFDSSYWTRIACNPQEVRRHIGMRVLPMHAVNQQRIQDRITSCGNKWPSNIGEYSGDWKEFEIKSGTLKYASS